MALSFAAVGMAVVVRRLVEFQQAWGAGGGALHNVDCPPKRWPLITSDFGAARPLSIKWP